MIVNEACESNKPCDNLKITKFVADNQNKFEQVAKDYDKGVTQIKVRDSSTYSILNYEKILGEMCDYLEGYMNYKAKGTKEYEGKVLQMSGKFYDSFFSEKSKYRKSIHLVEFQDINKNFLIQTKKLKKMIEELMNQEDAPSEVKQLAKMSDNQYRKIAKVYRDDMDIYLWLCTQDSKIFKFTISSTTRDNFNNANTPVMHKLPKKK